MSKKQSKKVLKSKKAYKPNYFFLPDLIALIVSLSIVGAFFIPWVFWLTPGGNIVFFTPSRAFTDPETAKSLLIIPLIIIVISFIEIFLALYSMITKKVGLWKPSWFYATAIFYIVVLIIWWFCFLELPSIRFEGSYISLNALLKEGGQGGLSTGLILIIVSSGLEIIGGIIASLAKR